MEPGSDKEEEDRRRDKVGNFLKKHLNKGELALKHAIGLGHQPNAVPVTDPVLGGPPRSVEVGWHPVGGFAGKWFAEKTGLGKMIKEKINKYPDPTQHWAVLVGDYAHQLWMDENFDVIYTNERINREEWCTFKVGETQFNDDATRRAGESVIQSIRDTRPAYNLITNNCQTYVLQLLDAIKVGMAKEFGTSRAVYERLVGPGTVEELFSNAEVQDQAGEAPPVNSGTVSLAEQVMNENTTQLDTQEELEKSMEVKEHKKSIFSRFTRRH
ncbi:Fc.00g116140.m01.CDS01 [Cosmosporella sp. VM-42]